MLVFAALLVFVLEPEFVALLALLLKLNLKGPFALEFAALLVLAFESEFVLALFVLPLK